VPRGFLKRKTSLGMAPLPRTVPGNKFDLLTVQEVPETESSEEKLPEKKKEETQRIVKIRNV
jgi:hypothetical protein